MHEANGAQRFAHVKNIAIGLGRVIWADGTTDCAGKAHAPGWVVPGGQRTLDEARARAAATLLNSLAQFEIQPTQG